MKLPRVAFRVQYIKLREDRSTTCSASFTTNIITGQVQRADDQSFMNRLAIQRSTHDTDTRSPGPQICKPDMQRSI